MRPRRCLVACSGGPDSVALVLALHQAGKALGCEFVLGHVNHGLRGAESNADAKFVVRLGRTLTWKVVVARAKRPTSGNLEEELREARYQLLSDLARNHRCGAILTAHTLNDQVETVLMNLVRGTGPDGLGGMRPLRELGERGIVLGRPFLSVARVEVMAFLKECRAHFRTDRTNRDTRFFRNWVRSAIVPEFEKRAPGFARRVEQLAEMARAEADFWDVYLADLERRLLTKKGAGRLLDLRGLLSYSPAVQRRLLRRVLGRHLLTFETIERLRRWMSGPATNGRIFQMRKGWTAERLSKSKGSPSAAHFWLRHQVPSSGSVRKSNTKKGRTNAHEEV